MRCVLVLSSIMMLSFILFLLFVTSEILRVVDSLQLTATKKVATPADWKVSVIL